MIFSLNDINDLLVSKQEGFALKLLKKSDATMVKELLKKILDLIETGNITALRRFLNQQKETMTKLLIQVIIKHIDFITQDNIVTESIKKIVRV